MTGLIIRGQHTEISAISIPWRLNILLDVSTSMDEGDRIGKAKRGIAEFLFNVSRRRNFHDWVTASCFSGYAGTKRGHLYYQTIDHYSRVADPAALRSLVSVVGGWKTVSHGTALYDAIAVASNDLYAFTQSQPGPGIDVVIAVTDGEDNAQTRKASDVGYPNDNLDLGLIAVGADAEASLRALTPYATSVHGIDDFAGLYHALFVVLGRIIERRFELRG